MAGRGVTSADLDRALEAHRECLEKHGIKYHGTLHLQHGSKVNGRAYCLVLVDPEHGGHNCPPIGDDYLGRTAREAYEQLCERTRVIRDTMDALGKGIWD